MHNDDATIRPDDLRGRAARFLGGDRERAFAEGDAALLARAIDGPVVSFLVADRVASYLNVLYAALLLRRAHELEPLHEDLYRLVIPAEGVEYSPDQFAQDIAQLEAWRCVDRQTEAWKLRGYKDNRRVRFRYRLTEDAVAVLEWLEVRLAERVTGRVGDSRDSLTDVLGQAKELVRLLDAWRRGERDADAARRAYHLASAIDEACADIARELLSFRAAMLGFAVRPYEVVALREILAWLERYVSVYLARVEELRQEIVDRLTALAQPRYRQALGECRDVLLAELRALPRELRGASALRAAEELSLGLAPFFRAGGRLATLCAKIDDSAREVLRKIYRHLRELERRSGRVAELRARVAELRCLPDVPDPRLGDFIRAVVGAAHVRFDRSAALAGERRPPPLPRSHRPQASAPVARRPLRRKQSSPEDARALRAKREAELGRWLADEVLGGADRLALSAARLASASSPRRWLDAARAYHLGGGKLLERLGVTFRPLAPARALLGTDELGLDAPDVEIARRNR